MVKMHLFFKLFILRKTQKMLVYTNFVVGFIQTLFFRLASFMGIKQVNENITQDISPN